MKLYNIYIHYVCNVMQTITFQSTKHTSLRNIFGIRLLVSPQYDIWGMSTKIPYWWCVTIPRSGSYIWLVEANFLHGTNNQKYTQWHVIRVEFLHSFLRHQFRGKPVVALRNVSCFLKLKIYKKTVTSQSSQSTFYPTHLIFHIKMFM